MAYSKGKSLKWTLFDFSLLGDRQDYQIIAKPYQCKNLPMGNHLRNTGSAHGKSISATRREFKSEYFALAAAFQKEPFSLSNFLSGGEFFLTKTSAGDVLCAKAIGLSGYDCMQNINWK